MRIAVLCAGVLQAAAATAQTREAAAKALMTKYAGNNDHAALLREAPVRAQLRKLTGAQLKHLERNLSVTGSIDVVGGALSVNGNAPHGGGEEEAVVCVAPHGPLVQAAIATQGKVTVFASDGSYDGLFRCIKDWITQLNSQHRDRMRQPTNVSVVKR
jgi:hypothetical protein